MFDKETDVLPTAADLAPAFLSGACIRRRGRPPCGVRDGEVILIDGPYAESAAAVRGFYSFAASSQDEAIALAARIPIGPAGTVEVRPIRVFG